MALFQQPITPPFMGGHQPLEGRKAPPSTLLVPNPPFSHRGRTRETLSIIRTYDPPPPPPFIGERQPLAPIVLPPSLEIVPNPPFITSGRDWRELLPYTAYVPPPPNPVQGSQLTPQLLIVPDPPFVGGLRDPRELLALLNGGIPPSPLPYVPRFVPPLTVVLVDYVPYTQNWLWTVLQTWIKTDQIIIQQKLSPGIPGQSVDTPPILTRNLYWTILQPPSLIIQARDMVPGIPGMSVDNPPLFSSEIISEIVISWQPAPYPIPSRVDVAPLTTQVDNPPFGMPPRWLSGVLTMWQPQSTAGIIFKPSQVVQPGPIIGPATVLRVMKWRHWFRSWSQ